MPQSQSERNLRWHTKYPEKHKANYENWRVGNQEKRNAYARAWHAKTKAADPVAYAARVRKSRLKVKYGLTPEEYDALLIKQNGHCALCDASGNLHVDHCHETGRIRGLLCTNHNTALGTFGDNEAGLLRAIRYLNGAI